MLSLVIQIAFVNTERDEYDPIRSATGVLIFNVSVTDDKNVCMDLSLSIALSSKHI